MRFWRLAIVMCVVCTLTADVRAQESPTKDADGKPLYFVGGQYGEPLRISAGFAAFFPVGRQQHPLREGLLFEGSAGQAGARASAGVARFLEYAGLDVRAVISRTWGSPSSASSDSTYLGTEGGLAIWYLRFSAGVARRIAGPSGPHRTIFTWGAGLQYPFAL